MHKFYNHYLGCYMPSFYYMELNFPFYSSSLALYNLNKKNLSTFIHEYIHFLQDISSYSLLNNAYVYSEYIHAATNCIYQLPKGKFNVPLEIPDNYGNIELNKFINDTCMGDFSEIDNVFVKKVKFKRYKVPYKNDIVNELEVPFLLLANGTELRFGTCAIMESMAYLIERHITIGSSSPKDYPYNAAAIVVYHEYQEFGRDELNIIALCDMSLQFVNPGKIFVETLRMMKIKNFLPDKAEDIYKYMYKLPVQQMGKYTNIAIGLINMGMMVQDRLKLYLNDPMFKEFHDTIRNFIGFGIGERLRKPHFMLDLVRNGFALYNNSLKLIMNNIGSPIIKDSQNNFTQMPVVGQSANESFQFFPAIEQIYKCFKDGSTICEMLDFCEETKKNAKDIFGDEWQNKVPIIDDNCWNSPWKKINDQRLCPYAVLWKHWKLGDWEPTYSR